MENHNHKHHSHEPDEHQNEAALNEGAQSLVGALKILFVGLRVAMVILIVLLFRTGCFTVQPDQQVLTFRFGKLQADESGETVYTSGQSKLNWVWPKPVGNTLTLPATTIPQTIEVTRFWEANVDAVMATHQEGKDSEDPFALGNEGYVITGDGYMYHVKATMVYYIVNPAQFYNSFYKLNEAKSFDVEASHAQANKVLRSHLEMALTMESCRWKIDQAFYDNVSDYRQQLLIRLNKDIQDLGYGVEVDRIDIKAEDKGSLRQVRGTFNQVSIARSEAQSEINKAKQEQSKIHLNTTEKTTQLIADAEVYRKKLLSRLSNLKELDEKNKGNLDLSYIYVDSISKILENVKHRFVIRKTSDGQDTYWLELGPDELKDNGGNNAPQ